MSRAVWWAVAAACAWMALVPLTDPASAAPASGAAAKPAAPRHAAKAAAKPGREAKAGLQKAGERAKPGAPAKAALNAKAAATAKAASTTKAAATRPAARDAARDAGRWRVKAGSDSRPAARAAAAARAASAARSAANARAYQGTAVVPVSRRAAEGAGAAALAPATPAVPIAPPSIGEAIGLHRVDDPLALRSAVALVVDPANGDVLFQKNIHAVLPIASITKVMTAMVVLDAGQPLDEPITIDEADKDTERFSTSRLPVGSRLTRAELLQLALMASENRAASALARHYPGGLEAFVDAANRKAAAIGMRDSVFIDGTGLSSGNVSTARDLAVMVATASGYPLIRDYSTAHELPVRTAQGPRVFRTTNGLVVNEHWQLVLQKTGYISEAGNCLVLAGNLDGRRLIMVLLDSQGRYSRLGDAQRLRRFIEG